jgi:flagellar basal-body rod modification protein FlgD
MSSIGSFLPATDPAAAANSAASASSSADSSSALANQSTFLQLLVTQLKNQDPSQPMDGTTFVTQLATFSDLEQNLASRQDLDAIKAHDLGTTSTTPAASTPSA